MRLKKVMAVHHDTDQITLILKCDCCGFLKQITALNEVRLFEEIIPKIRCVNCSEEDKNEQA